MVLIQPPTRPATAAADAPPSPAPAQPEPAEPRRLRTWYPVIASGAVMAIMGFWGLDRGSMYGTEDVSYWAGHLPLGSLFHLLSHVDAVHGLYYLMLHVVFLFGGGESLLRIPSVLGMTVGVMLAARVAYRLSGSAAVSLGTGLIMAALPVVDDFAQVGRSYAIDLALVMATSLALLRALGSAARPSGSHRGNWILYAGLVVLSGYMHEMTALMLLAHGVTLLWSRADRRTLRDWAVSAVAAIAALIPLIMISHAEAAQLDWITFQGWSDAAQLVGGLLGPSAASIAIAITLIVLAIVPGRRAHDGTGAEPRPRRVNLVRFALPLFVLPGAALLIESAIGTPLYGGVRYVLYSAAGAAMLAAFGAHRLGSLCARLLRFRRLGAVTVAVAVIALLIAGLPAQATIRTVAGQPQDMHGASAYVAKYSQPGDAILYIPAVSSLAPLGYPHDFAKVDNIAVASTPLESGTYYGIPKAFPEIRLEMLARRRIWELSDNGTTGMSPRKEEERDILQRDFHVVTRRVFTGVTVLLWVRDSST